MYAIDETPVTMPNIVPIFLMSGHICAQHGPSKDITAPVISQ